MKFLLYLSFIFTVISGCELYPQDEYQEYYVVECYLIAENYLPRVYLSTTAPISALYKFEDFAVTGASVKIELLSEIDHTQVEETFDYTLDKAGIYSPRSNHIVLPTRTYRLSISKTSNTENINIEGVTTVPDVFTIESDVPDSIVYQSQDQLEIEIKPNAITDQQKFFIFTTIALSPSVSNFTPIYADLYDAEVDSVYDFEEISSGIVNESNFDVKPDGTITLRYPWIAVAFYENNQIVINIIDQNIYDFVRTQSVQLGGSTLSPGEIPNVKYNIDGGIGIFGSIAANKIQTYIKRPQFKLSPK